MSVPALLTAVLLLATAGPVSAAPARTDTTLTVSRGDRLVLVNFAGRLSVGVAEGGVVRVQGRPADTEPFRVERDAGRVTVWAPSRHDRGARGPFQVAVPPWLGVEIRGPRTDTEARGLRGGLQVRSLHGSIRVQDVSGSLEARTVHGEIVAEEVSGSVRLHSVEEDVRVRSGSGEIEVGTVDGDLVLEAMDAERVTATSVDGDIRLDGRLPAGASYRLTTHDGDLRVVLAGPIDAEVAVSTFDGEFTSDFPVTLRRFRGGQEMRFTLGEGGSELVLEAFDGDIQLRRGGG